MEMKRCCKRNDKSSNTLLATVPAGTACRISWNASWEGKKMPTMLKSKRRDA